MKQNKEPDIVVRLVRLEPGTFISSLFTDDGESSLFHEIEIVPEGGLHTISTADEEIFWCKTPEEVWDRIALTFNHNSLTRRSWNKFLEEYV